MDDLPKSENLARIEAKEYWITAAAWRGEYGTCYEIGVRWKVTDRFELLQSREWCERTVKDAAKIVQLALDSGFTVMAVREAFGA